MAAIHRSLAEMLSETGLQVMVASKMALPYRLHRESAPEGVTLLCNATHGFDNVSVRCDSPPTH